LEASGDLLETIFVVGDDKDCENVSGAFGAFNDVRCIPNSLFKNCPIKSSQNTFSVAFLLIRLLFSIELLDP
jgi:hypothetical protein